MTAYGGELAPAAPSPGVAAAGTGIADEVTSAAGQERESSSLTEGCFSLVGEKLRHVTICIIKRHSTSSVEMFRFA